MRSDSPVAPDRPLTFEGLWLPAIEVARRRLTVRLSTRASPRDPGARLSRSARLALERSLLVQLTGLAAPALLREFSQSRPFGIGALALLAPDSQPSGETGLYDAFVSRTLADGLVGIFARYPVLARLAATLVSNWVEAVAEFVERFAADRLEIARVFGASGEIRDIRPWLSDPHNGGRTVFAIELERGPRVMYKPRSISLEADFQELLRSLNARGADPAFRFLTTIDRREYGWIEAVEAAPCSDAAAAGRFYRRAGMLLAVIHALRGTDCHRENLIAAGEHLVLIDAETLMHHDERPMDEEPEFSEAEASVQRDFAESVLRTGLLPRWDFDPARRVAYDVSGLGSFEEQSVPRQGFRWKAINTDDMCLVESAADLPVLSNVPALDGRPLSASDYLDSLAAGFEEGYRLLLSHRDVLTAAGGPLDRMMTRPARYLFRATQTYSALLERALEPELLRDGLERSLALEALTRGFLFARRRPEAWPIFHAEMEALERLDVPLFGGRANERALSIGVEPAIPEYFRESSADAVRRQIAALSEDDLRRQLAILFAAFRARTARPESADLEDVAQATTAPTASEPPPAAAFVEEARNLAQRIAAEAIRGRDGSATWIDVGYVPGAERFQLQPLGASLYDGSAGIGLFLAGWSRVSADAAARELAFAALDPARRLLHGRRFERPERLARELGPGGVTGLGSLVYALSLSAYLLDDEALARDALGLATLLNPELHAEDAPLDVMSGAAGAVLALLSSSDLAGGDAEAVRLARLWGERLLARRTNGNGMPRAWATDGDVALTGFSHGAAGIACALFRLGSVTGESRFMEAAREGIAWENTLFDAERSNWPDLRPAAADRDGRLGFRTSWCHGAAGIGLARAAGSTLDPADDARNDVERALAAIERCGSNGVDHLCCGEFGRIELLLVAARQLDRSDLLARAARRAAARIEHARRSEGYRLFSNLPASSVSPSFFRGLAGVGWELLRLADPDSLPSVALLEPARPRSAPRP